MGNIVTIICGTTSSGKTALALKLAADQPTSIISADSRQIYSGLDIITGKDIPSGLTKKNSSLTFNNRPVIYYEKDNIRLWGFDLLNPDETYNAGDFSLLSRKIIREELATGRKVFVVGGTGFYMKALVHPEFLSEVLPNEVLRSQLENLSVEELSERLWELNPQRFVEMNQSDASNPRRLVRAIEVASSTQTNKSQEVENNLEFEWVGKKVSLEDLKPRIEERINNRIKAGVIGEVKNLMDKYPDYSLPVYSTLGVKPVMSFLKGEIDEPTMIKLWLTDELNYAKRQITWFKKQPEIVWYD